MVKRAFTIVELLIVIIVIGILAALILVTYKGVTQASQTQKINADLEQLSKAIMIARIDSGKTLYSITGFGYTATGCVSKSAGTDLAALVDTADACWTRYSDALSKISQASGMVINPYSMLDPWGRPYLIDENEGESGGCTKDLIAAYVYPSNGSSTITSSRTYIPLSGNSGCVPS